MGVESTLTCARKSNSEWNLYLFHMMLVYNVCETLLPFKKKKVYGLCIIIH